MNVIKKAAANHIDAFKNLRQIFVMVDENISCRLPSEIMSITFIPDGGTLESSKIMSKLWSFAELRAFVVSFLFCMVTTYKNLGKSQLKKMKLCMIKCDISFTSDLWTSSFSK